MTSIIDTRCPHCGVACNRSTPVRLDDAVPAESDLNICIECAKLSVYTAEKTLRAATQDELEALPDEVIQIIRGIGGHLGRLT